tara:strand:+ start:967 stop:1590 length:624 start_codon:yes stop_codon:yes gene_type:complete
MIFDFSDKINKSGIKIIFSNNELNDHFVKKKSFSMNQTHSTNLKMIIEEKFIYEDTDGIFSNNKNHSLIVRTADCLPIFFIHQNDNIFGVLHAGWKGLKNEIIMESANLLKNYVDDLSEMIVFIGPSISQKNYEVKNEFINYFGSSFIKNVDDKLFCNLKEIAKSQLNEIGITRVIDSNQCTYENENYHSFRRNKTSERMVGVIYYE